jgi:UDP-N-acetyl-D-mannosaminuronic acid dehydrogenase
LTDCKEAVEKADIIVFLVAHDEFKNLTIPTNKIVLDFCGIKK